MNSTSAINPVNLSDSSRQRRINSCFSRYYSDFRRLAGHICRREPVENSLHPTALVHEIYLRLLRQKALMPSVKGEVMGVAARQMRQALIDRARRRLRRRGAHERMADHLAGEAQPPLTQQHALLTCFQFLESHDPHLAHVAKLKIMEGKTLEEIGRDLNMSTSKAKKDWLKIKALLIALISRTAS